MTKAILFFNLLVFISLTSCSTFASLRLDPDDIRPWNGGEKGQFPSPLGAVFKQGPKTLVFVGDHHVTPEATYKVVEAAFDKFAPEIAVVEGLEFSQGENPQKYLAKFLSKSKEDVWKDPSLEPGTELLSMARHVPFIGGEPTIEEQMASPFLRAKGFSPEDIRNVQILQRLPYRRDQLKMTDVDDFFRYAMDLYRVGGPEPAFKESFHTWYKKRAGKDFDYRTVSKDESAVNCAPDDTVLQAIACAYNINRDRFLVAHVETLLKRYDRVLVVYGTGHFVQEYPAFKKAFAQEPSYFKADE
jgi:hypothetical protein